MCLECGEGEGGTFWRVGRDIGSENWLCGYIKKSKIPSSEVVGIGIRPGRIAPLLGYNVCNFLGSI